MLKTSVDLISSALREDGLAEKSTTVATEAEITGEVEKNLSASMANCRLTGSFDGDVEIIVNGDSDPWPSVWGTPSHPNLPGGLTVTDNAEIAGNVTYKSIREGNINRMLQSQARLILRRSKRRQRNPKQ